MNFGPTANNLLDGRKTAAASKRSVRQANMDFLGALRASWSEIDPIVPGGAHMFPLEELLLPESGSEGNAPFGEVAATAGPQALPSLCDVMTSHSMPQCQKAQVCLW